MNTSTYQCRNRRCELKTVPGWMLGSNARCPACGRWLTKLPDQKPSVK